MIRPTIFLSFLLILVSCRSSDSGKTKTDPKTDSTLTAELDLNGILQPLKIITYKIKASDPSKIQATDSLFFMCDAGTDTSGSLAELGNKLDTKGEQSGSFILPEVLQILPGENASNLKACRFVVYPKEGGLTKASSSKFAVTVAPEPFRALTTIKTSKNNSNLEYSITFDAKITSVLRTLGLSCTGSDGAKTTIDLDSFAKVSSGATSATGTFALSSAMASGNSCRFEMYSGVNSLIMVALSKDFTL